MSTLAEGVRTVETAPVLVAVAHGSRDPAASAATRELVEVVRSSRPAQPVVESYLDHATPRLSDVLPGMGAAVVVPLLLGDAYHSRVDIPSLLGRVDGRARQAAVLGPDPQLLTALERRLAEQGVQPGDPSVAVVLAAAGATDARAVDDVRRLANTWRSRGWWAVEPAFASAAAPDVAAAVIDLRRRGAPTVAVASYLLFPGVFGDRLAAAGADVVSAPLGAAPEVAGLVLARFDAAVALAPQP